MSTIHFKNIGFYQTKLNDEDLKFIKQEISDIQAKFNTPLPVTMNEDLAGNIAREYELSQECRSHINLILQDHLNSYLDSIPNLPKGQKFSLTSAWVNFQRKHEFNPVHDHHGLYSFVIWIKIPYSMENEKKNNSVKYSNMPVAGAFSFLYNNSLGFISSHTILADVEYESTVLIFPASLKHCVYPFYTSDDYRISVSGNFR